jgi:4-amino-4-deoxychorismate lyase
MNIQLIETMRVEPDGSIPLLDLHLLRLEASCRDMAYRHPGPSLAAAVRDAAEALGGTGPCRLRLLLDANGAYSIETGLLPSTPHPVALRLAVAALPDEPFWLRHKTTHRPWYAEAQEWLAAHPRYFDILFCNGKDEACEGSRSNVYMRDESGTWLTPPVEAGLLPGVQRQRLLDHGLARVASISRKDLLAATELRVSNALRGWLDAAIVRDELEDKEQR